MSAREANFRKDLQDLLNRYGKDTSTNVPAFILAHYLMKEIDHIAQINSMLCDWRGDPDPNLEPQTKEV